MLKKRQGWVEGEVGHIPLTKGYVMLISPHRVAELSRYNWSVGGHGTFIYAFRYEGQRAVRAHRHICGLDPEDKRVVDHINHNTLDNRDENLRVCTHQQNGFNRIKGRGNRTGHVGVSWHKGSSKFQAGIVFNGKVFYLGVYSKLEDAVAAREDAARRLFGGFANAQSLGGGVGSPLPRSTRTNLELYQGLHPEEQR